MERIILVKPSENFIKTLAKFIISSSFDPLATIIIFPNIRPSYYLKKEIASIKNSETIIPKITSLDEFVREFCLNHRSMEEADFYDAFYIFSNNLINDLMNLYRKNLKQDDILNVTSILWSEFEELKINQIDSKKIRDYDFLISDLISKGNNEIESLQDRFVRYSNIYNKFYSNMEEINKMTRAMMYVYASQKLSKSLFPQNLNLIVAGFYMMTKSEKYIFEKIYTDFNSYFFFQEHELLNRLGNDLSFMKDIKIKNKYLPNFEIKSSPSKHCEIFALKNDIIEISKVENDNISIPSSTAIILPDQSSVIPLIENLINNVDEFNITVPYTLINTPWMSLFETIRLIFKEKIIIEGRDFYPFKRILSFLSHQYIKKLLSKNILLEERFDVFLNIKDLEKKFNKSEEVFNLLCFLLESFRKIIDIYQFIESVERLTNKILANNGDIEFLNAGYLIINELKRIKQKSFVSLKFENVDSYFQLLENILNSVSFPFKGEPLTGLQCLGMLEARLLNFKNVFILDMNDGIIPYYKKDTYMLSEWIRKKLGLPLYSDSFNLYYYHLSNIILSSEKAIIYFVENKKMRISPIIEKMLWEKEKNENKILELKNTIYPKLEFLTHKPKSIEKGENIKKKLRDFIFSNSSLELYLECPLMFYYQYVLGIRDNSKGSEIEINEVGQIFHKVLQESFTNYKDQTISSINKNDFINCFNRSLNNEIKRFDNFSPQLYFIKSQISFQAESLINRMKNDFKNYKIKDIEVFKNYEINVGNNNIKASGKIDLILENDDNIIVVDFKTSSDLSNYMPKLDYFKEKYRALSCGSLQLPFYIWLFKETLKETNACIISLGSKLCDYRMLYQNIEDKNQYQPVIEKFIISNIIEIIEKDHFEVPKNPPCKDCVYYPICGI
ncbi:MAG: PD-(D/E)XK nuclease family protein [Elusimicrobiales bacterium]|nr:PD-(D/E)XK nuclease family protein [Elusimicrobiales bacterium]